ncbi:MAG: hypothetical protein ACKPKO_63385, partial [Candidatus Fonsibacter sp.]
MAKDTEEFALLAEPRLRSAEQAFYREVEQNEVLGSLAKEVAIGNSSRMKHVEDALQKEISDKINAEYQVCFGMRSVLTCCATLL